MPLAADGTHAPELGQSPQWSVPSDRVLEAVRATPTLVLDRDFAFPSLQASRAQAAATQSQSASSNNNALKWVGVGMMIAGGLWTLSALQCGAVSAGSNIDGIGGVYTHPRRRRSRRRLVCFRPKPLKFNAANRGRV